MNTMNKNNNLNPMLYFELAKIGFKEGKNALKFLGKGIVKGQPIAHVKGLQSFYKFVPEYIEFWKNYGNQEWIDWEDMYTSIKISEFPSLVDLNRVFRKLDKYPPILYVLNDYGYPNEILYLVSRGKRQAKFTTTLSVSISLGYEDILTYERVNEKDEKELKRYFYRQGKQITE